MSDQHFDWSVSDRDSAWQAWKRAFHPLRGKRPASFHYSRGKKDEFETSADDVMIDGRTADDGTKMAWARLRAMSSAPAQRMRRKRSLTSDDDFVTSLIDALIPRYAGNAMFAHEPVQRDDEHRFHLMGEPPMSTDAMTSALSGRRDRESVVSNIISNLMELTFGPEDDDVTNRENIDDVKTALFQIAQSVDSLRDSEAEKRENYVQEVNSVNCNFSRS